MASALYIVDAHRKSLLTRCGKLLTVQGDMSIEGFTCLLVFKNLFSFGLTYAGYQWLIAGGVKDVFVAVASVQVGLCALTIPLYFFGKRNRSFFARNDILKILHLW